MSRTLLDVADVILDYYESALALTCEESELAKNFVRDCGVIMGRCILERMNTSLPNFDKFKGYCEVFFNF